MIIVTKTVFISILFTLYFEPFCRLFRGSWEEIYNQEDLVYPNFGEKIVTFLNDYATHLININKNFEIHNVELSEPLICKQRLFSILPSPTRPVSSFFPVPTTTYKITIQRFNINCNCLVSSLDILLTSTHN